jgi:hypothetical protein
MGDIQLEQATDWGRLRPTPVVRTALAQLLEAGKCAGDAGRDPWDFAVEIGALDSLGVTAAALRWLVCRGFVEHAREVTRPSDHVRHFRSSANLSFVKETCFILTTAGMAMAGDRSFSSLLSLAPETACSAEAAFSTAVTPHWDHQCHILSVGDRTVKQFRVPSPNQEAVLQAFQGEGWPVYVADPLPVMSSPHQAKVRLHDTIKCLNARQKSRLIRFRGDGCGVGVLWELVVEPAAQQAFRETGIRRAA